MAEETPKPTGPISFEKMAELVRLIRWKLPEGNDCALIVFSDKIQPDDAKCVCWSSDMHGKRLIEVLEKLAQKLRQAEALPKN